MAGRTLVMGIVNVTPDSFSDGGRWLAPEAALAHAHRLAHDGADILDVGGESTRPGARRVDAATECDRVLGIIRELALEGHTVSVDTVNAVTAHAAVAAGAAIVNDVSGGLADPDMGRVIAETGVPYVVQHWRGTPETMAGLATSADAAPQGIAALRQRPAERVAAGGGPVRVKCTAPPSVPPLLNISACNGTPISAATVSTQAVSFGGAISDLSLNTSIGPLPIWRWLAAP